MIPLQQQIFAIIVSLALLAIIIELVRTRRLREEYSWIWLMIGSGILVLAIWPGILDHISRLIGAVLRTTTLFIFGTIVNMIILAYYAVKMSRFEDQVKTLTQKVALLEQEMGEEAARAAAQSE